MKFVYTFLLALIAFGTIWTAYESHIANIGVIAWQHQFDEIRQPDGVEDNHAEPVPKKPQATPTPDNGDVELDGTEMSPEECKVMLSDCKDVNTDLQEDIAHCQAEVRGQHSL